MDDVDRTLPDHIVAIVVLRLCVRPQPAESQQKLPREKRPILDLPDREVWITSTRSSTASADQPRFYAEETRHDDDDGGTTERHL